MRRCLTCRTRKKGLIWANTPSPSLLSIMIACSEDWVGSSCSKCIGLHIPCVGEGRNLPTWQKVCHFRSYHYHLTNQSRICLQNVALLTFCRRIISDQIKERRRRRSRARRKSLITNYTLS